MMRKPFIRWISGGVLAAASIFVPTHVEPVKAWTPKDGPDGYFSYVGACEDAQQMDCIESVGAYINGKFVAGQLTPRLPEPSSTLVNGVWVKEEPASDWWGWYQREWSIPGLVNEDGLSNVQTVGRIAGPNTTDVRCRPTNPPSNTCIPWLNLTAFASTLDGFRKAWENSEETNCSWRETNPVSPNFGMCLRSGHLQEGIRFRVSIRVGWLLPTVVVTKTDKTVVSVEKLSESGASRVVIEGVPYRTVGLAQSVDWKNDPNSRASWNDVTIKMSLLDGRYWRGGMYARCAEKPPIVVADNSWAPSSPSFDASGGLQLNVSNSHYDTDGKTPFEGRYNGTVPFETASCLWGSNLSSKSQFVAEVIEESTGEKKAATTAVSVNSEALRIDAYGFTFSSPTIRVKYVASEAAVSPKKMTITCKKGKVVRKVTSLKPRCPAGFKKA